MYLPVGNVGVSRNVFTCSVFIRNVRVTHNVFPCSVFTRDLITHNVGLGLGSVFTHNVGVTHTVYLLIT